MSIIVWILIGAVIAWITSVLWRHPHGCVMDGVISVVGVIAGVLVYGAIVGSAELIEVNIFSILAGVVVAFVALAITRAVRRDVEAETEPSGEQAAGWEAEEAAPAPDKPLSERDPEDVGEARLPDEKPPSERETETPPEHQMTEHPPEEPMVEHEPRHVDTEHRPDDGSPGPDEVPDQEERESPHDEDTPPPRA
jgi:uncharacterized membrane protein YeaQ/YmgE (transglycosylase-associated protein family)